MCRTLCEIGLSLQSKENNVVENVCRVLVRSGGVSALFPSYLSDCWFVSLTLFFSLFNRISCPSLLFIFKSLVVPFETCFWTYFHGFQFRLTSSANICYAHASQWANVPWQLSVLATILIFTSRTAVKNVPPHGALLISSFMHRNEIWVFKSGRKAFSQARWRKLPLVTKGIANIIHPSICRFLLD